MTAGQTFWNRIANRYAARPIRDLPAYEAMLDDVAARLRPGDKVLEVGCGTGGTAIRLAPCVSRYVATDFSTEMIRIARGKPAPDNLQFRLGEAGELPEGAPFDVICAFNLLHLVEDMPHLLHRFRDNLAPGGLLVTKTWCFADLGLKLRLLFRFLRVVGLFPPANFLTQAELRAAIEAAGFEIIEDRSFGTQAASRHIVARRAA